MMENRSFDNLLGWLYTPGDMPKRNILRKTPPTFMGLAGGDYSNSTLRSMAASCGNGGGDDRMERQWRAMLTVLQCRRRIRAKNLRTLRSKFSMVGRRRRCPVFFQITRPSSAATPPPRSCNPTAPVKSGDQRLGAAPSHSRTPGMLSASQTWPNRSFLLAGSSAGHANNEYTSPWISTPSSMSYPLPTYPGWYTTTARCRRWSKACTASTFQ